MALDNTDSPEGNDGNDSSVLKKKTNETLRKDSSNVTKTTDDDDTNDSSLDEPLLLSDSQRLAVDKNVVSWALFSLRLGLIADSISMAILAPNYPFMVNVNQHPDSFPSIEPFGFNAATYFLPMTAMLGSAFSSVYVGSLSDRVGRRPCILVCVGASVFGNILKYLARNNFWAFCGLNFLNGLFGATLPVALAYVSDIHPNRDKKNDEIGKLIGFNMMGVTGGGVVAILMQQTGLFTPLFVGAAFNFLATVILYFFLLEPDKSFHFEEESTDDDKRGPPTLKKGLMAAIIGGAILDNIGSAGLWPLALSPLAFVQFYDNFVQKGLTPIMTETAYKWISMILAVMVIPGAALSGPIFSRFGAATACVFGNIVTAIGITAVLLIATMDPPTNASFGGFIVVLYLIMPFTVLSNLSTGPMLDMIAPVNKRGFVQGINSTTMNIARSASPFVLGAYADAVGVVITMWTCVGISVVAALANTPLTFVKQLKPRKRADHSRALEFEDEELVDHIKQGKWVPPKQLAKFYDERYKKGLPFIVPMVRKYADDKECLKFYKARALEDFRFTQKLQAKYLSMLDTPEHRSEVVEKLNKVVPPKAEQEKLAAEMGNWFADYMKDAGYFLDGGRITVMKQMIMEAFPPINKDGELTEDNIETTVLKYMKLTNDYFEKTQAGPAVEAFAKSVLAD